MAKLALTRGYVALIDDADHEHVTKFKWHANVQKDGGVYASNRKCGKLHRFILGLKPEDPDVDHKNGNGLDCRRSNLRLDPLRQNTQNTRKRRDSKHRFKGVSRDKKHWRARFYIPLGPFTNDLRAAVAYDIAARALFGEFARTNFQLCPLKVK